MDMQTLQPTADNPDLNWEARLALPGCVGIATAFADHSDIMERWRETLGRNGNAVDALSDAFEDIFKISAQWFNDATFAHAIYDGHMKPRYLAFRYIVDRLLPSDWTMEATTALVRDYIARVPYSHGARLCLADLLASQDQLDDAIAVVKSILNENSLFFLPQEILVKHYRAKKKADPSFKTDDLYIGDLKNKFCSVPFDEMMTDNEGLAWTCCPSFLPTPIGNIYHQDWQELWNSPVAQELRRSIIDGSFRYCNRMQCGKILAGTLPRRDEVTDLKHVAVLAEARTSSAPPPATPSVRIAAAPSHPAPFEGPRMLYFCHDATCNLACLQCRAGMIRANAEQQARLDRLLASFVKPAIRYARKNGATLLVSGNGDPFASEHYLDVLRLLDDERDSKIVLHLITNGLLFKHYWNRLPNIRGLLRAGYVGVSIDAASPETYLETRGASWEKLLENLEFIAELRRGGIIGRVGINYAVQACNFRDMKDIVAIALRLGVDGVGFNVVRNHGTYLPEEYKRRAVFEPDHPCYEEFLEELRNPIFRSPIIVFDSVMPHYVRANGLAG